MKKINNIEGKCLIFSAPSGAGKTTLVKHLLSVYPQLTFSVSATNRPPREGETEGKDYYFLSDEDFKDKIANNAFIEWEEVYDGRFYGTLLSEIEHIWSQNKVVVFDVDVVGGVNLKKHFENNAMAIFIRPPSIETLKERLLARGTESLESLQPRINKAAKELEFEPYFDCTIVNDTLAEAKKEAVTLTRDFLTL